MGGDDYVIDEKRNKAWATTYEAMQWYRAELEKAEQELENVAIFGPTMIQGD